MLRLSIITLFKFIHFLQTESKKRQIELEMFKILKTFKNWPLAWFFIKKAYSKTQSQIEITGSNEKFVGPCFCKN